jgi:cell division protein FtsB
MRPRYQSSLYQQVRAERRRRAYVCYTFLVLALLALLSSGLFGDMGLMKYQQLRHRAQALRLQVRQLKAQNQELRAFLEHLRKDSFVVEKHAREEFGWARPEEYIFRFEPSGKR